MSANDSLGADATLFSTGDFLLDDSLSEAFLRFARDSLLETLLETFYPIAPILIEG